MDSGVLIQFVVRSKEFPGAVRHKLFRKKDGDRCCCMEQNEVWTGRGDGLRLNKTATAATAVTAVPAHMFSHLVLFAMLTRSV